MHASTIYSPLLIMAGLMTYGHSAAMSQTAANASMRAVPGAPAQLQMLKTSSRLRLHAGNEWREGRLVDNGPDSIDLVGDSGDVRIAKAAIDGVWVRRHNTLAGFLIGTALGAAGYLVATSANEDGDLPELDNIYGGAIWGGSALLGTLVGAIIPRWKRVYP